MKRIIVAIDSLKGCLTSVEANAAAYDGIKNCQPEMEVVQIPVSDGGEGWTEAFHAAIGGELVWTEVHDPLMRTIQACYLCKGELAVIEMAKASGLTLLKPEERDPMVASTYGTGEMIADAVRKGCKRFIVGLGGSATSDAGIGMLEALRDAFINNKALNHTHQSLRDGSPILGEQLFSLFQDFGFSIATDVKNPLCGPMGAAYVFGPQKGATPEMVELLDERARVFAERSARQMGYDCSMNPGAGAAGGIGYAFMQYLHAESRSGIDLLLDTIGFDKMLKDVDLVITGEGSSDAQTLMGKLPSGILHRTQKQGVPTVLIAGRIADKDSLLKAGFSKVVCINPPGLALEEAMRPDVAKENISYTVRQLL